MTDDVPALYFHEIEGPRQGSLEDRAALALKILAAIYLAGLILAMFPGTELVATLHTAMFNLAAAVLMVVFLVVAIGLGRRTPWAVAGVRPLLALLAISGIYATLAAASEGRIKIPFDAALAIWAVLGLADRKPLPRPSLRTVSMIILVVPMMAMMVFGRQVFGFGGLLDVREDAIEGALHVDCGPPGGEPPALVRLTYDWTWSTTSPLPSGLDIVVVGWTNSDLSGRPLYLFDAAPQSGIGVYPGRRREPSMTVSDEAAAESLSSWQWGVELAEQGFRVGQVVLVLERIREASPGETLTIKGAYVHLGLWRRDAATVTCAW